MSQRMSQPLYTDNPSSKYAPGEKDDRQTQLISCWLTLSQNHSQEIISSKSLDSQEELIACLERFKDLIKDNLAEEELIDDPAEVVLDRLAVSLDWTLVTAMFFMITGMLYLRLSAFAAFGNATTHQLLLQMTQITNDTATNNVLLALLEQTSPESPPYTLSRELVQTSVLSSCLFATLMILGKFFMGRNGINLNMPYRRRSRSLLESRRHSLLGSSPDTSRRLILILSPLPNTFLYTQLLLGIAFVVSHYLAV
ncbi:hypothetical protein DEU56DRAFT_758472 [Suillus clintonianus]|uniref:uncharacterized protein n=1 Tax=Suillus clintonianus TaxID=1904413 RepID=UPI001B881063|nr:uncharacterized protein DEU56DRAFT_758472 [Suillus clintonianus]KAG2128284.1 hypothetical protein DEU56DRAFT_758472 [Suillus clintonianus]